MEPENKSGIFQTYANAYDSLYQDKDYLSECDFIEAVFNRFGAVKVNSILDMGCGTGGHAVPLGQRGYEVIGIDRSPQMIAVARQKQQAAGLLERLCLEVADIQNIELGRTLDAVICMFAVLGYQISNEDVFATLRTARKHLDLNGIFICDFWYGPAVLEERPSERVKMVNEGADRIIRLTKPALDIQKSTVIVNFQLLRLRENRMVEEIEEAHPMRFFFKPEIEFFFAQAGFNLVHFCPFLELGQDVSEKTWNVAAIARAV